MKKGINETTKALVAFSVFLLICFSGYSQCTTNISVSVNPSGDGITWDTVGPSGTTICNQNIKLTAKHSSGCAYSYYHWTWSTAHTSGDLGCISGDSITITPDMASSTSTNPMVTITYTVEYSNVSDCSAYGHPTPYVLKVYPTDSPSLYTAELPQCPGVEVDIYNNTPKAGGTYSWTSKPAGFSSSDSAGIVVYPLKNTTYYLTETTSHCHNTDSLFVAVNPRPVATAGTNAYICLQSCSVCTDKSAIIGTNSDTAGNTYAWSVHRSGSPVYITDSRISVTPTVITTYYLTTTTKTTGCTNSDSVVITIGTNDTLIGDSETMGWYGHRHDCHNTAYDIVITGDSSI